MTFKHNPCHELLKRFKHVTLQIFDALSVCCQIMQARIEKQTTNHHFVWNTFPGSLHVSPSYSGTLRDYPFYYTSLGQEVPSKFTALIYARSAYLRDTSPLYALIQIVAKSPFVEKVKFSQS